MPAVVFLIRMENPWNMAAFKLNFLEFFKLVFFLVLCRKIVLWKLLQADGETAWTLSLAIISLIHTLGSFGQWFRDVP